MYNLAFGLETRRHRADAEAFQKVQENGGTGGATWSGQEWAAEIAARELKARGGPLTDQSSIWLGHVALPLAVPAGDKGDRLRDRHAGKYGLDINRPTRRRMSCRRCRGGYSLRCNSSASCAPASRDRAEDG